MGFYDNGFKTILTASLNTLNTLPTPLLEGGYLMTRITPIAAETPTSVNTETTLFGNGALNADGVGYGGTVVIQYRRLDLNVMFRGIGVSWSTDQTTTATFGEWLAETYGIPVSNSDFETVTVPPERNVYLQIPAAASSPWLFGDMMVYLPSRRPVISDVINEDWDAQLFDNLPPVDANYRVSYPFDYSGYASLLLDGENPTTDAERTLLWNVLFGDRPSQWDDQTTGILYEGEAAVVDAGGRSGFNYLLLVPRLNAWAHFNYDDEVGVFPPRRTGG